MNRFWIWVFVLLLPGAVLRAEDKLELRTKQKKVELQAGQERHPFLFLPIEELFIFRVKGPEDVGIRFRVMLAADDPSPGVDLTVVRDGLEQGTVRFSFPSSDGASIVDWDDTRVSGEILVKIEIPEGHHEYSMLVTGPRHGCLIHPFLGLRKQKGVVVATPGKTAESLSPRPPRRKPRPASVASGLNPSEGPLARPDPEVLIDVNPWASLDLSPEEAERRWSAGDRLRRLGLWTRISGSFAGLCLVGTVSLLVSSALIEQQADQESVQIPAADLFERSRRGYQFAGIMGGLSAVALGATALLYWLERSP